MVIISENGSINGATEGSSGSSLLGGFAGLGVLAVVFLVYVRNRKPWWWTRGGKTSCEDGFNPPTASQQEIVSSKVALNGTPTGKVKIVKSNPIDVFDLPNIDKQQVLVPEIPKTTRIGYQPALDEQVFATPWAGYDLISLAEKGKVGVSADSSRCSSTASSMVGDRLERAAIAQRRTSGDLRETKIDNDNIDFNSTTTAVDNSSQIDLDLNCNRDCIVVLSHDLSEDKASMTGGTCSPVTKSAAASGLVDVDETPCGHLEVAVAYDAPVRKMTVHVLQARLPIMDAAGGTADQPAHTQVRLILLPSKKQKCKTKIRSGENPHYMESFVLHRINPEDVNSMGIRLRLYGCERMRRERIIGEAIVSFAKINLELENHFWLTLQPRANAVLTGDMISLTRSDSTGSRQSMQHGGVPELLLGLCYNATTGRLSVEVVKGSHFSYFLKNFGLNRAPDTYVKLNLVSSTGQELAHTKTTTRRGQPNPLFKETFVFQVALFQLADVTLMVVVYNRKGVTKKKEMVGWFSLGLNSSGAEELQHWMDMKEYQQEQIFRWHVLIQS
ncbi:unnamed protein product [Acanthoscelides obtectus]|uniref:C2 domain-containing protein n=2 Tax=Acanthoscelides obtectus TaxID=200917 RepID=A0A9P0KPR9_ACAOB|nr:unnamed protein product [Acanthoscelides obtectus]CAK1657709.1 Synaptotagmin-14 [Acanthoscelides obtectus]